MIKMLTEKRGALQGLSSAAIVRSAYGPVASLVEQENAETVIMREGKVVDTVIDIHED